MEVEETTNRNNIITKCFYCKMEGHATKMCPIVRSVPCKKCKLLGHLKYECPKIKQKRVKKARKRLNVAKENQCLLTNQKVSAHNIGNRTPLASMGKVNDHDQDQEITAPDVCKHALISSHSVNGNNQEMSEPDKNNRPVLAPIDDFNHRDQNISAPDVNPDNRQDFAPSKIVNNPDQLAPNGPTDNESVWVPYSDSDINSDHYSEQDLIAEDNPTENAAPSNSVNCDDQEMTPPDVNSDTRPVLTPLSSVNNDDQEMSELSDNTDHRPVLSPSNSVNNHDRDLPAPDSPIDITPAWSPMTTDNESDEETPATSDMSDSSSVLSPASNRSVDNGLVLPSSDKVCYPYLYRIKEEFDFITACECRDVTPGQRCLNCPVFNLMKPNPCQLQVDEEDVGKGFVLITTNVCLGEQTLRRRDGTLLVNIIEGDETRFNFGTSEVEIKLLTGLRGVTQNDDETISTSVRLSYSTTGPLPHKLTLFPPGKVLAKCQLVRCQSPTVSVPLEAMLGLRPERSFDSSESGKHQLVRVGRGIADGTLLHFELDCQGLEVTSCHGQGFRIVNKKNSPEVMMVVVMCLMREDRDEFHVGITFEKDEIIGRAIVVRGPRVPPKTKCQK